MPTNIIALNRGDTFEFDIPTALITEVTGLSKLQGNDAIYFGLMDPNQRFEDALVKKRIDLSSISSVADDDGVTISIQPDDTLDLIPGRYFYMVKLKADHINELGERIQFVKTLINKTKFIVYD